MINGEMYYSPSHEELEALRRYEQLHRVADNTAGELGHVAIAAITGGAFEPDYLSYDDARERQERTAERAQATRQNLGAVATLDTLYGRELTAQERIRLQPEYASLGYAPN